MSTIVSRTLAVTKQAECAAGIKPAVNTQGPRMKGDPQTTHRNLWIGYIDLSLMLTNLVLSPSHFLCLCALPLRSSSSSRRRLRLRREKNGGTDDRRQVECQKKGSRPQRPPIIGSLVPDLWYAMLRQFQPP